MKSTKRSLFASVLALILCVCMLIGTTWAWFTDEVQSGVNQIVAGNLDVELYNANGKVESNTMLFDVDLWEPGMVVYENFTVKNVGNLALKYQLSMTTGDFNTVDGHSLKEVLKVAVVPNGFSGDRAAAENLSGYKSLDSFSVSSEKALLPTDAGDTFGVVIWWQPGDNDNDYNLNNDKKATTSNKFGEDALGIELGVKLLATQLPHEEDSFDKFYDDQATYSETVTTTVEEGENTVFFSAVTPSTEKGNTTTVTVPKEVASFVAGNTSSMTVVATPTVAANNKFTVSAKGGAVGAIDLTIKVNDTVVSEFKDASGNAIPVTVETYVAKGLTGVELKYNGEGPQPTDVTYVSDSGKLSWKTVHFSTFVLGANEVAYVESNNTAYLNLAKAMADAKANDTVVLLKDVALGTKSIAPEANADFTIDMNGHNITGSSYLFIFYKPCNLTFDGQGKLTSEKYAIGFEAFDSYTGKDMVLNVGKGVTVAAKEYGVTIYPSNYLNLNGKFNESHNAYGVTVNFYGKDESGSGLFSTNGYIQTNDEHGVKVNLIGATMNGIGYQAGFADLTMQGCTVNSEGGAFSGKSGSINMSNNTFNVDLADATLGYDYAWCSSGAFGQPATINLEESNDGYAHFSKITIDNSNVFNYLNAQEGAVCNDVFHMLNGVQYSEHQIQVKVKYVTDADFVGYIEGTMFGGGYQIKLYFSSTEKMNAYQPSDLEEQQGVSKVVFNNYYDKNASGEFVLRTNK